MICASFQLQCCGEMLRSQVRFPEKHDDCGFRMALAQFRNLAGGVAVAHADGTKIASRRAIEAINRNRAVAGCEQQRANWFPIESPIALEAETLAQLFVRKFAALPGMEQRLIARKDCLETQYNWASQSTKFFENLSGIEL